MPTPPDFTAGTSLAAASLNKLGLWLIKTETVGTGVSSVTVSNCFSADFENYRVIYNITTTSATGNMLLQFNNATGNTYYTVGIYFGWANSTIQTYAPAVTNKMLVGTNFINDTSTANFDVLQPNQARRTYVQGQNAANHQSFIGLGGLENSSSQHTGFTINPTSGTLTGGTIRVYGYRN